MITDVLIIGKTPRQLAFIRNSLERRKNIQIIATVCKADEVYKLIDEQLPRVLLITEQLCDSSAFNFIKELIKHNPHPVLLVLDETKSFEGEDPEILQYGFVDHISVDFDKENYSPAIAIRTSILAKLNIAKFASQIANISSSKVLNKSVVTGTKERKEKVVDFPVPFLDEEDRIEIIEGILRNEKIIVIGASSGGPKTLVELLSQLPSKFPPVLIVQHMPVGFITNFAMRLDKICKLKVAKAVEGELITKNRVYVAPAGNHLGVKKNKFGQRCIHLTNGPKVNFVKPSVDVTLKSAINMYKSNVIAVILTGMGSDGTKQSGQLKQINGEVLALSEKDSMIFGMNRSVIDQNYHTAVLDLQEIPKYLNKLVFRF